MTSKTFGTAVQNIQLTTKGIKGMSMQQVRMHSSFLRNTGKVNSQYVMEFAYKLLKSNLITKEKINQTQ
jgi:hypothetical protein